LARPIELPAVALARLTALATRDDMRSLHVRRLLSSLMRD